MTRPSDGCLAGLRIAVLITCGCSCSSASGPLSLSPPTESYTAEDYPAVQGRWTRHGRVVRQLDTALKVHATLISPEFRAAYIARWTKMFRLPPKKRAALAQEMAAAWAESYTLVFGAATHDFKWNDFHRKNTIWRLALVNGRGDQVEPRSIERLRRSPTWTTLYPYLGPFFEAYKVRFPRTLEDGRPLLDRDASRLILRFAGPLGDTDLIWQLQ